MRTRLSLGSPTTNTRPPAASAMEYSGCGVKDGSTAAETENHSSRERFQYGNTAAFISGHPGFRGHVEDIKPIAFFRLDLPLTRITGCPIIIVDPKRPCSFSITKANAGPSGPFFHVHDTLVTPGTCFGIYPSVDTGEGPQGWNEIIVKLYKDGITEIFATDLTIHNDTPSPQCPSHEEREQKEWMDPTRWYHPWEFSFGDLIGQMFVAFSQKILFTEHKEDFVQLGDTED
eukprot:scaffold25842_cov198-Amphora_coffeaeformis.AAC.12